MNWPELDAFLDQHEHLRPYADLIALPPDVDDAVCERPEVGSESDLLARGNEFVIHDGNGTGLTRLAHYIMSRRKGTGHKMAVSFAMQQPGGANTNDTFWSGRKPFWEVHGERYANEVRSILAKRGVSLGSGQEYLPELARFKGDPEAVVPSHDVRGHIRAVCEKRGMIYKSPTDVQYREPESDPLAEENCVPMAPDLVKKNASRMIRENPGLARKTKAEVRQMVLDKHGPSK